MGSRDAPRGFNKGRKKDMAQRKKGIDANFSGEVLWGNLCTPKEREKGTGNRPRPKGAGEEKKETQ